MEILEKQCFQSMFAFLVSVLYFGSCCSFLFLFSCLFTVGFRFLCVSPFGIQFVSIFLLWNSWFMFPRSFSLFSLVFGSCTAKPLGTRTCRSVHTKTLADHPQVWHETNENCYKNGAKDDNKRWENHITVNMKQNDQNDSPKSVADTFSNFSKQINGHAG